MVSPAPLGVLKQSTAELVALGLRSESAVIARLVTQIIGAVEVGYSHRRIHETIVAGGLATSWTNYRIAVGRARKAQRSGANVAATTQPAMMVPLCNGPADCIASTLATPQDAGETYTLAGTSSATSVMNALRQARDVAISKDYGQLGLSLYRQQQRAQRNQRNTRKDRP